MSTRYGIDTTQTVWREVDGEIVILGDGGRVYLGLNPSGALLWKTLADGATKGELEQALTSGFPGEVSDAAVDVVSFLSHLRDRGLLTEA